MIYDDNNYLKSVQSVFKCTFSISVADEYD